MNALLSNPFKRGLLRGETQIGLWLSSTSSYMAEIAATSGYDWLLIDGEHAPNTIQDLYHQLQAIAPYASQPVIRPVEGNRSLIKQVLDIGARTLLVPMVDTAEQAREVVSATRYPPIGSRGVGAGVARAARWGRIKNYMAEANDELCLLIQVESRTALENLDAILEVDGIDGVFIGPADLSASLGHPDDAGHPDVQRVIEQSIRRIRAAGKAAGFLAVDPAMAEKCLAWGGQLRGGRGGHHAVYPGAGPPAGDVQTHLRPAAGESELLTIDGGGWRWAQASACASTVSGCSQRLRVDISICHLQVSQSVTTMSAPLSSIWRNSGAPIAWDTA